MSVMSMAPAPVMQVLKYYHLDAMEAYNSTSDLRMLCSNPDLIDPTKRIKSSISVSTSKGCYPYV